MEADHVVSTGNCSSTVTALLWLSYRKYCDAFCLNVALRANPKCLNHQTVSSLDSVFCLVDTLLLPWHSERVLSVQSGGQHMLWSQVSHLYSVFQDGCEVVDLCGHCSSTQLIAKLFGTSTHIVNTLTSSSIIHTLRPSEEPYWPARSPQWPLHMFLIPCDATVNAVLTVWTYLPQMQALSFLITPSGGKSLS